MNKNLNENGSFFRRFITYQNERFPLIQYIPLISIFTFSASSYSRMCRNEYSISDPSILIVASITSILYFLFLRISDEFKDFDDDMEFRPYRAVPRGLVSLKELKNLGFILLFISVVLNAVFMPVLLLAYGFVIIYMYLMYKEFFISKWLKAHPITYAASHMLIMPIIDFYTTGVDWLSISFIPPNGVEVFLIVSFFNGMVIEIGRKIRIVEKEENGVETYSKLYGANKATVIWIISMFITMLSAIWACYFIDFLEIGGALLIAAFILSIIPGLLFLKKNTEKTSKLIESVSGVWTILMYLIVGAAPMIIKSI